MRSAFMLVGLLQLGDVVSLPAQHLAPPFVRWEPSAPTSEFTRSGRGVEREADGLGDYRYEGLAIGGVALGALGVWVGSRLKAGCAIQPGGSCYTNTTGNAIALGLVGAAVGSGVGYLIGRLSPKRPHGIAVVPEVPAELVGVPDSVPCSRWVSSARAPAACSASSWVSPHPGTPGLRGERSSSPSTPPSRTSAGPK